MSELRHHRKRRAGMPGRPLLTYRTFQRCALTCALLSLLCPFLLRVQAATVTEESIKEKEAQIEQAKQEQSDVQSSISDLQSMKDSLESKKANLQEYVTQLDAQLTEIQNNIDSLNEQITQKEADIEETAQELEEAEQTQEEQYESMKARCQFIYEKGDRYELEALLKSASFSDMLNKFIYIQELSKYDDRLLNEYREQTELVRTTKEALEEEEKTLSAQKSAVEEEQANAEALMAEKKEQLAATESEIAESAASIEEYQAQLDEQTSTIASLEQSVAADKKTLEEQKAAEEAARQQAQQGTVYSGGVFTWPCPSYSYISSEYGYRVHPIYGRTIFHSGLDMAASYGAPILAAASGTVVAASYDYSMGNYVMISHGGGLYTIYMHASALYVSAGQSVSAGQQIAAVGSTGNSTGPHLHFSVRLNGSYVNPWSYLTG